ncbi:MAG: FABP family protein [Myxococcales bacterium]|nr:FABP family protein [Myxococcales bacterium]
MDDHAKQLGPLGALIGTWEGNKGADVAPSDAEGPDDRGTARSAYRERLVFEPIGRVDNHAQKLFGLRYRTTAYRIGADESFHEEVGYWLWEPATEQVMRCFIVPRGISVIAGGHAKADASSFELEANVGSATFGICSNPFLDREFRTVRYQLSVEVHDDGSWSYAEDTQMQLADDKIFHHTDSNRLRRVS